MIQWNGLMFFFLAAFFVSALVRGALRWLNIRHLRRHGHEIPEVFQGQIDGSHAAEDVPLHGGFLPLRGPRDPLR